MSSSQGNRQRVSALKPRLLIALVCLLSVMAALPHASQANLQSALTQNTGFKEQARDFIPGEILVRFRNLEVAKRKVGTLSKLQAEGREIAVSVEQFAGSDIVEGLRLARVAPEDTLKATEALNAQADVLYAEPNYIRRKDAAPNDPRYAEQWALKNTVPTGADIDAEQIWDTTTGSRNVVVGVVDEGIDINHPDLRENIWRNPAETPANNLDDDGNGFVDDVNGYDFFHQDASVYDGNAGDSYTDAHGTHVAGTIGAHSNNGEGVAGVNWQVSLMSLKILGREDENPAPGSVLTTVQAYSYAKMMRDTWVSSGGARGANLRVLNNSYGGFGHSQAELDAILALGQSGILFVASAGNDSSDNDRLAHYPSNHNTPNMISVASSGRSDVLSPFSNYGRRSVSMAAPGQEILSTTPNGTYTVASGTSMASPHVAGAAALLLAVKPDVSVERLRAAIIYSGDELYDGGTKIITGRRLNAANALQNLNETDTTPPGAINDLRIFDQNNRNLTLQWTEPGDDATSGAVSVYQMRFSDSAIQNEAQFEQARPLLMPRP
ncbi:MAG TPA: S8 family peptidase, partial [Pyrinomonadaceae bacterium]